MRRHDLVLVSPQGWHRVLASHGDPATSPLIALWAERGWPLVARRAMPGEHQGVALGLPLPPCAGKGRLAFLMRPEEVISASPPPALRAVRHAAPRAWWPTLDRLGELASRHAVEVRVFGGLAWRSLTGLDYLTAGSDLDLLLHVDRATDLASLTQDLAEVEAEAPMRLDGELVDGNGAAVNWREFHTDAREVLVKSESGVVLLDKRLFHTRVRS